MSNYSRKAKRQNTVKEKAPRCCGQHMVMNRYGLWQCRKCGNQKMPISMIENAKAVDDPNTISREVVDNSREIIDVEPIVEE